MKTKALKKTLALAMTASMTVGLVPSTVFAVSGDEVAADGVYTGVSETRNSEVDPDEQDEWDDYEVNVSLTVQDGVFADITVEGGRNFDPTNQSYLNRAYTRNSGIKTLLVGQPATEDTINGWDAASGATITSVAIKEAALEAIYSAPGSVDDGGDDVTEGTYVMMNIPYADFYAADVNNDIPVDIFSSATLNKTRTSSLAGGSYHVDPNGTDISGVTFPVLVEEGVSLEGLVEITDESSVDITVTNRGQTTTTTYTGMDALFESASYSYYVLSEEPAFYKELSLAEDGTFVFGETIGEYQTIEGVEADLSTSSRYGDYQINLEGVPFSTEKVYGVILETAEGASYGLRHMENIWRGTELAWSTGFTTEVHGCPTSWEHYVGLMGSTVTNIIYYTPDGIYDLAVHVQVPVKFDYEITVADAEVTTGAADINVTGLPDDFDAEYIIGGIGEVSVEDGKLLFGTDVATGNYTLTVNDRSGRYASISAQFMIYTDRVVAEYDSSARALKAAENATEEEFASYVNAITSVTVDGRSYNASGRGAVTIINEDGSINRDAAPIAELGTYEVTVNATGYLPVSFTYENAVYVLMNIPYADFYKNDVNNDVPVDVFSSATFTKTRQPSMVNGSYHVNADGSDITGVTFPVKLTAGVDLSQFKQITDESSVDITIVNRGQESTTTYSGSDALFENESYAYYILSDVPSYYKELSQAEDGSLDFGATVGEVQTIEGIEASFSTSSRYGDYQINLRNLPFSTEKIYGVILETEDGASYGLRHMENIWRGSQLAWCTGFTTIVRNCPTSSEHYMGLMGSTVTAVKYMTADGIYEMPVNVKVPVKFTYELEVADAVVTAGETSVTLTGLPDDFDPEFTVEGIENATVEDGKLIFGADAAVGRYTLTVTDKNDKYFTISRQFTIYTEKTIAAFDDEALALKAVDGVTEEEFAAYIQAISSVSVNGRSYSTSGRGAVTIINEDGSLKTDAAPIAGNDIYEMTVNATGYLPVSFTYDTAVYVLMNIPYADFYKNEVNNDVPVDIFSSATLNKTRTGTMVGGSYHVDPAGTDITGVTFPVKLPANVDLSQYKQITDESSVDITVTNRGQTSTTTYTGSDALFESDSYSYYILTEKPSNYKAMTVSEDGSLEFGKIVGEAEIVENVSAELYTSSGYGDYQINLEGVSFDTSKIYGIIFETEDGASYGLRHMENIWLSTQLAWSTGFTTTVHNCPTSWEHYVGLMGSTITGITYYTADGIHTIPVNLYVPVKFESTLSVEDAPVTAGETAITLEGFPEDYEAQFVVGGIENISVADGKLVFGSDVQKGRYTLTVSDASGKYSDYSTQFVLYIEDVVAEYDAENLTLKAPEGVSSEQFMDYLNSISSVTVNDRSYSASGRGAVTIINQVNGNLVTDAQPFAEQGEYQITVSATGYLPLSFTYSNVQEEIVTVDKAEISKVESTNYQTNKITWKAIEGAEGYRIYYRVNGGKLTYLKEVASTVRTYTHSKVETGTKYTYYVRAFKTKSDGTKVFGDYSAGKSVTPKLGKATISKAASASYQSNKITWKAVSGAKGYRIYYRIGSGKLTYLKQVGSSTRTYTHSKLKTGTKYTYYVRAFNTKADGTKVYGAYSAGKAATPKLGKAAFSSVKAGSSKKVALSWKKVSGASGYRVYYKTSKNGSWKYLKQTSSTKYTYTNSKFKSGQTVYYTVRAYRNVSGKKVYGALATTKSVKIK